MSEYIPVKTSSDSINTTHETNEMTDSEDQFTSINDKQNRSSMVTFNKTKMFYTKNDDQLFFAHFSAFLLSFKMNDNDRVGICRLPDDTFIISKLIKDCETDVELENLDDIGLLDDDRIIAKKVSFNIDDLLSTFVATNNNNRQVYFQFCYQNSNGDIMGKSTPFQIKDVDDNNNNGNENSNSNGNDNDNNNQPETSNDDEDFIVVRSQESFLKERIEHLTKSNNLLQYLIRNMEKDIVDKENENKELTIRLNSINDELTNTKKSNADNVEMMNFINYQKDNLDTIKIQLEETLNTERELRKRLEKELIELKLSYQDYDKDLKESNDKIKQFEIILSQKEDDLSLAQDLIDNLRKANNELIMKNNKIEDSLETSQSALAKIMDERRSLLEERNNWQTSLKSKDETNVFLLQRCEELEKIREKQSKEIKSLEDELRQSIQNLKNINTKSEKEQSLNLKQQQDIIIKNDKLNADYIEMRARLEQAKIEYGNLYQKYSALLNQQQQNNNDKSNPNVKLSIDPIDRILNEMDRETQSNETIQQQQQQTKVKTFAEPSAPVMEPPLPSTSTSTPPSTASPSTSKSKKSEIIKMPCTMCDRVIDCYQTTDENGQMKEMIEHFEKVHKQKMCPVCSVLFDTRLSIFQSYFQTHLQNHFNQIKYPQKK